MALANVSLVCRSAVATLAAAARTPWALAGTAAVAAAYAWVLARIMRYRRRLGDGPADAALYAAFCVLGRCPNLVGLMIYRWNRLVGRAAGLIEYKDFAPAAGVRA